MERVWRLRIYFKHNAKINLKITNLRVLFQRRLILKAPALLFKDTFIVAQKSGMHPACQYFTADMDGCPAPHTTLCDPVAKFTTLNPQKQNSVSFLIELRIRRI